MSVKVNWFRETNTKIYMFMNTLSDSHTHTRTHSLTEGTIHIELVIYSFL